MTKPQNKPQRKMPPSFDFYPDDFMGGVTRWKAPARGMYISLLCHQWNYGFVPDDREELELITHAFGDDFERDWPKVKAKFEEVEPGKLVNARLDDTRKHALSVRETRASSGRKGGKQKAKQNGSKTEANANRLLKQTSGKPEEGRRKKEEGSRSTEGGRRKHTYTSGFENFWACYPKQGRADKHAAFKSYQTALNRVECDEDPEVYLSRRAGEYATCRRVLAGTVKHATTWLNRNCWEDSPEVWDTPIGQGHAPPSPDEPEKTFEQELAEAQNEYGGPI